MSGSKDKQRRRSQKEQGFDLRNPREIEAEKKRRKQTRSAVIVLVIFAVVAVFLLGINSNLFYRNMTALNVDGQRFSIAEMNFFFAQAHRQVMHEGEMPWLDPDMRARDQMVNEYQTLYDYVYERAVEMARTQTFLHRRAVEEGIVLSEELREQLEEIVQSFEDNHAMHGFPTVNSLLVAEFGTGMNMRIFRNLLEFEMLGQTYTNQWVDRQRESYTTGQLEAFYLENVDDYESIRYRMYTVFASPEPTGEEEAEDEMPGGLTVEQAREQAEAIAAAARTGGEEGFFEAIRESLDEIMLDFFDEAQTQQASLRGILAEESYGDWVLDASRRMGDVTVIEDENVFHVLYFLEVDDNDYYTANVRHILIMPEHIETHDEDGEPLDIDSEELAEMQEAAQAEALVEAEAVLAQWRSGAATEESFIELVREYSADFNPEFQPDADPGLFDDIHRNSGLVAPFRDWALDPNRQVGDAEIVETQFGYHIMYFVGHNEELTFRHTLAQAGMLARDHEEWQEEWQEEMEAQLPTQTTFFSRFVAQHV